MYTFDGRNTSPIITDYGAFELWTFKIVHAVTKITLRDCHVYTVIFTIYICSTNVLRCVRSYIDTYYLLPEQQCLDQLRWYRFAKLSEWPTYKTGFLLKSVTIFVQHLRKMGHESAVGRIQFLSTLKQVLPITHLQSMGYDTKYHWHYLRPNRLARVVKKPLQTSSVFYFFSYF